MSTLLLPFGLSSREAARRLACVGRNRLVTVARWRRVARALAVVADPMAIMLALAGGAYLAFGDTVEGIVLLIALVPVLGVDIVLEARSRKALSALRASVAPRAHAVRDGVESEVPTETLVPGDVLAVHEGDVVFADARLERCDHVSVDEAHLTGESEPQDREAGDAIFAGSRVLRGRGYAVVIATGVRTAFGSIAALVDTAEAGQSPLQHRVTELVEWLGIAALALALVVFGLGLAAGIPAIAALLSAISLAMAAIPEEFPLVLTLYLALGAVRLGRRGVLVRRLASVEALGSTTVICTDKTGTLTRGRFDLAEHRAITATDAELLTAAALACEPAPDDIMERSIIAHCAEHGVDVPALHATWRLAIDHPFEADGKHMTHVWASGDRYRVVMKGALEGVLQHCAISDTARTHIESVMAELGAAGMRVLAVAARDGVGEPPADREAAERELELFGLLGFRDPLRPEVPAAITACRNAGIAIKVVTGDHAITARAIAEAAGIHIGPGGVVTGDQLALLDPDERTERIRNACVLARIRPEQKYDIVDGLVRAGEVVAMTGDGVNDAPALRRASIGVSMGRGATEVARAAAGLVLLENDFSSLVSTIREGRVIYANLQRAFLFLIAFHIPIISLAVVAPALGLPLVLLPIHLVWLELVVHPVAALVFEAEPASVDVMAQPPRGARERLLPRRLVVRAAISGGLLAAAAFTLYVTRLAEGVAEARAVAMTVLLAGGIGLVWAERALDRPWRAVSLPRSRRFWIIVGLVALSIPLAIGIAPVAEVLQLAPIRPLDAVLAIAMAAGAVLWRAGGARGDRG